jgi:transcriptional regulator with XRE-family HTH domain
MVILNESKGILAFGQKVRSIRKDKNFSMQHLANIAEIEVSQIHRIETGKINPKLTTILILAKALDINASELFS